MSRYGFGSYCAYDIRYETNCFGLDEGFLDATSLAEYLVRKGIPFRQAHGIVGSFGAHCEKQSIKLADLKLAEFKKYSPDDKGCL